MYREVIVCLILEVIFWIDFSCFNSASCLSSFRLSLNCHYNCIQAPLTSLYSLVKLPGFSMPVQTPTVKTSLLSSVKWSLGDTSQGASLAACRHGLGSWSFSTISLFFKLFKQFFKNTSTITGCFNDLLFSYSSSSFFRLLHQAALTQRVWNNAKAQMTEKPLCLGR